MNNLILKMMVSCVLMTLNAVAQVLPLPKVYAEPQADFVGLNLRNKANLA